MPDRHQDDTTDLPESIAILVVDTKGFSQHNDIQQEELTVLIPEVLERAFRRCDLDELWDERMFPDSTGDGYIIGFNPRLLPAVIDRFLDALQDELAVGLPGWKSRNMRLRMRLSLEIGPARDLGDPRIDSPVGSAMIATHRLVDAEPLRALLDHSDPDVTLLAVALSDRVLQLAVVSGRTRRRVVSEFVTCPVVMTKKDFAATAHLHVPKMSGELLRSGLLGVQATAQPGEDSPDPAPPATTSSPVNRGVGSVSGTSNNVAGRDLDLSRHESTVHGDQYNARRDLSIMRDRER